MIEIWIFRLLVLLAAVLFGQQMFVRVRLFLRAKDNLKLDDLGARVGNFVADVVFQRRVFRNKPLVGLAHLFVFWGFVAFGGYTLGEFLKGLGIVDITGTRVFHAYTLMLVPFASAVLVGIVGLVIRRGVVRPRALGDERVERVDPDRRVHRDADDHVPAALPVDRRAVADQLVAARARHSRVPRAGAELEAPAPDRCRPSPSS